MMSNVNQLEDFETKLNVSDFLPEEITVQTDDRFLVISGEHEEHVGERGFVSRHFIRRFLLPDTVDPQGLVSHLSPEGILTVRAPLRPGLIGNSTNIGMITMRQEDNDDTLDYQEEFRQS